MFMCVDSFRSIVLNCLLTHKPSLRAAIQCFLLTAVCNLTNCNAVGKGSLVKQVLLAIFTESLAGSGWLCGRYSNSWLFSKQ